MSLTIVLGVSLAYLLGLFGVAWWADRRAAQGRSVIANAWVYALSMAVYCTAWTYFGSVGRAATSGAWFLPIYLGPTLAMVLAYAVLRKMIRIARAWRITSIADFIGSRYGKSPVLAALVTLIALVGVVPYVALQLKAVASGLDVMTGAAVGGHRGPWWADSTLWIALVLAGFTVAFGTRHLDTTERHEGMVAAIAVESVVKLVAFVAVGLFVCFGLFDGPAALFERAEALPQAALVLAQAGDFAHSQWAALMLLAGLSVLMLPRQFQVMVVENVDERHLKRAAWAFPAYLLLINIFVLPVAIGGLLHFGPGNANPELFVLTLPLSQPGMQALALLAFVGGLSAATGMVIVEAIAVATMVCNDLVLPWLLRRVSGGRDLSPNLPRLLLAIRRSVIVGLLLLGFIYYRVAGEAYALVSIGLISFAAVAQFAPALLGGLYWRGGTREGALAGLGAGALVWAWTLLGPSLAKSGWLDAGFLEHGPFGLAWLRPEGLFGVGGLDPLTHSLFFSLLANVGLYVAVSLRRAPDAAEAAQAVRFVDIFERDTPQRVFWRGRARVADLVALLGRFLGPARAQAVFADRAVRQGVRGVEQLPADAALVQFAESQLAGAIGSASARAMVASVVEEEALASADVLRIVEEAAELRHLNERLESLDKLKDDFISSVSHELRTPLTSIRALAELVRDDEAMDSAQRQQFVSLIVAETERLTRLVNQVLDLAKIESGHAQWHNSDVDLVALVERAATTTAEMFRERGALLELKLPAERVLPLRADADRLTQVLMNLLSNAAKFVPPGTGRVRLQLHTDAQGVQIDVHDNGTGVAPEQRGLIFEKFRQGGDAAARPQGTGLGLPISRQIVEHFGGRLWLQSSSGEGSTFSVWLPWRQETRQ